MPKSTRACATPLWDSQARCKISLHTRSAARRFWYSRCRTSKAQPGPPASAPRPNRTSRRAAMPNLPVDTAARSRRAAAIIALSFALLLGGFGSGSGPFAAEQNQLRICADPNNMPFSNEFEAGFENKLAAMVAHSFGERPAYVWWAQRRGFVRNTLKAALCDVIMGV